MTDLDIEARNALDVLAVLTEGRPGNVRLGALDTLTRALKVMRADAQTLADVRTLDEWAGDIQSRFWAVKTVNEQPACCLWALDVRELAVCVRVGSTPDEARAKAAAWVREQAKKGA